MTYGIPLDRLQVWAKPPHPRHLPRALQAPQQHLGGQALASVLRQPGSAPAAAPHHLKLALHSVQLGAESPVEVCRRAFHKPPDELPLGGTVEGLPGSAEVMQGLAFVGS
jgi:hypothetical protein